MPSRPPSLPYTTHARPLAQPMHQPPSCSRLRRFPLPTSHTSPSALPHDLKTKTTKSKTTRTRRISEQPKLTRTTQGTMQPFDRSPQSRASGNNGAEAEADARSCDPPDQERQRFRRRHPAARAAAAAARADGRVSPWHAPWLAYPPSRGNSNPRRVHQTRPEHRWPDDLLDAGRDLNAPALRHAPQHRPLRRQHPRRQLARRQRRDPRNAPEVHEQQDRSDSHHRPV